MSEENLKTLGTRLSVQETVYWQQAGVDPAVIHHRSARWLESDEQIYTRTQRIGMEWEPLELGWIVSNKVSLLIVRNLAQVNDQRPKRKGVDTLWFGLEVPNQNGLVLPVAEIFPGHEDIRITPLADMKFFRVRASGPNVIRFTHWLIPA